MYRIDTHQARTDLYGIGKGGAQVIDPSLFIHNAEERAARRDREEAANQASGQKSLGNVYSQLQTLNKNAVMARDRPKFAQMQSDIYDDVRKNIHLLRSGDPDAVLSIQQKIGNLFTEAELSKNTREQVETIGKTIASDPSKYRPESIQYFTDFTTNPDKMGDYQFDPSQIKQNYNYVNDVTGRLNTYVNSAQKETPLGETFTLDQAKDLIRKDVSSRPEVLEQAQYDFEKAPDKMGAKSPEEFYAAQYAPLLIRNNKKEAYYTGFGGNGKKPEEPTVSGTLTKVGPYEKTLTLEYVKPPDNPYLSMPDPDDPSRSMNAKPLRVIKKGKDIQIEVATDQGEVKNVDFEKGGKALLHDKFGIDNIYSVMEHEKIPSHMKVITTDIENKGEGSTIRVRRKSDGKTGTIKASDFNESKYDKL